MRITYTGRQVELAPAQLQKLEAQCVKLAKMLDGRKSECEARVVLSHERHLHKAEVTVEYHDHSMVGFAEDSDLFTAIHGAIEKLEKQAIKVRAKWRDSKRVPRKENIPAEPVAKAVAPPVQAGGKGGKAKAANKIHGKNGSRARVRHMGEIEERKSMTLEEAIAEMGGDREYLTFLDAKTGAVNVLVRRRDGHFDLVEA
jgi:putative sigma-54 modulation protein